MTPDAAPAHQPRRTDGPVIPSLLERPSISIRARIGGLFGLLFVLICLVTIAAVVLLLEVNKKQGFLDTVTNIAFQIQQARRYEKDYFLYGTDLPDALASIHTARNHLERDSEQIQSIMGNEPLARTKASLERYQELLDKLLTMGSGAEARQTPEARQIEAQLRKHGAEILSDAEEMIDRERLAVHALVSNATLAAVGALIFLLIVMAAVAAFIIRSVLGPLGRFLKYTARIGAGDYSPILPARKYRDEFSKLALAFNQMLKELTDRQEQLLQSRKMAAVGTLTSGIAHELNNPLNNIGLTTEALLEGYEGYSDDDRRRMLDQIYTQVERAAATVRNLLDFTRKQQPAFTPVSIAELLETTSRLVSNEINLSGVELRMQVDPTLPEVAGNPRNLQQVFVNLFLNSLQAMPDGGILSVKTRSDNGMVRVDVTDTGVGISQEDIDKIFDPFFTTKDPGAGTGLGLSVSYSIVESHHGRLTVESEIGKGTTFSVFLPHAEVDGE